MADYQWGRCEQDGLSSTRRRRRHGARGLPPGDSDAEDERSRQDIVAPPREASPYYDTRSTSSRHSGSSYNTDYTTRAVHGSIISSPQSTTNERFHRDERFTTHPRPTALDDEIAPPLLTGNLMLGAGAWVDDPPHRGHPQPTYGHNGLPHHVTPSGTIATHDPLLTIDRQDYQTNGYHRRPSDDGESSRSDGLTMRRRSPERRTGYSNTPRQRYDHPERREYHESHEYDEHRNRHRRRDRESYVHQDERYHRHRPRDLR